MGRVAVASAPPGLSGLSADPHAPTPLPGPGGPAKTSSRAWWPWVLVVFFVLILAGGVYALVNSMNQSADAAPVPKLLGLTQAAAETEAKAAGFALEVAGEEASTLPAGQVTRQDPEEGVKLPKGDPIRVWLAAAVPTVKVPDLVGMTPVDAVAKLNGLDLTLGSPTESPSDKPVGTIVSQDPAANKDVPAGTVVSVVVSSGPGSTQVKVPDLVKMDQDAALALLDQLKLKGSTQPRDSDRPAGEVVDQSPKAGVEVAEGSTVTIWASNGSVTTKVKVDDVVGKTRAQAVVILTASGFKIDRRDRVDAVAAPGTVVAQVPAAGTSVDKGSTVTIYVAVAPPPSTTTSTTTSTTEPPPTTTTTPPPTG